MKKIKTLLLFFVVGLFLFIGINSNAATKPTTEVNPQIFNPTESQEPETIFSNTTLKSQEASYSEPFVCRTNYEYVQVYIEKVSGGEKMYFVLQEYDFNKNVWLPALGDPGSEILIKNNLKTNIYLMYCGKDKTNYTPPKDAESGKIFSVSVNSSRYAVIADHRYRIMAYNCWNFGGKSCTFTATLQVKNL